MADTMATTPAGELVLVGSPPSIWSGKVRVNVYPAEALFSRGKAETLGFTQKIQCVCLFGVSPVKEASFSRSVQTTINFEV